MIACTATCSTMEISSVFTTSTSGRVLKFVKNNEHAAFAVFSNTAAMAAKLSLILYVFEIGMHTEA